MTPVLSAAVDVDADRRAPDAVGRSEGLAPTVVICAYTLDRWALLGEAVHSVEEQEGATAEIVVVIDHNRELFELAREAWPHHVVVENRHAPGLSGARNTGVSEASGAVVAFLDDDAVASPSWLDNLVRHFDDELVGGVGGAVEPRWVDAAPSWFPDEFLWVVGCSYRGMPDGVAPVRNPIGANMAFRRSVLDAAGGFSEAVGRVGSVPVGCEETELSLRAGALGYTILYDPTATVGHVVPGTRATLRYFLERCQNEGRSKAVVSRMAKGATRAEGRPNALATEQRYVARVLPLGVVAGVARSAAIVVGLVMTSVGYVEGRLRRQRSVTAGVAMRRDDAVEARR